MLKRFQANNINCQNCANTILVSLEDDFGDIEVDLSKTPREVSVELADEAAEAAFKAEMSSLGFDVIAEVTGA
ncbi:heavy metal transport/detoxification protein [Sulfurospirillum sp. T05]|uniref:Heavy metal transport/detoxification protein n=1 Tax=Sulfurospirillum tamanense TaxID=2813362 RepID=A0ABS2WUY9_9BACT|nr:heavy metal transport/detoxification protein [Sulfurospirillum tamanensis]MBN2965455.1 heavy metal transport/detoxification protein [Sulfurospirillum tamanensis]